MNLKKRSGGALLRAAQLIIVGSICLVGFNGCRSSRNQIKPFFNSQTADPAALIDVYVPQASRIQKEDLLGITVSSLNKESNDILNFSTVLSLSAASLPGGGGAVAQPIGYSVDSSGNIAMAFVGKIRVEGLSLEAAQERIRASLNAVIKEPAVNIRFMNHRYVVLGEVSKPGTYHLLDDRTTLLDALASAGDLSIYAKRDSISIIRIVNDKRVVGKVSLMNREVFKSPYFYVRNGDVIYIDPVPEKSIPQPLNNRLRNVQVVTTIIGTVLILASLLLQL
ncbi:polysaccharide biosynthesis/export family protein [Dyadobacter alkalitolerans]|uniref:polysaccharide biosynthesis/export family protein n=1 Tax=Dyadobacter alkalitolerans TaxID=492736 RepID=UPI00042924FC|nr:polysaccharide biosynthesis/export family protein [Dyadobacter alkalitolerans]